MPLRHASLVATLICMVTAVPQHIQLEDRADASSYPSGQPVPQLIKNHPNLFYWPAIYDTDGVKPEFLSPANQRNGIVNPQDGNWFGTGLFGYDGCTDRSKINDAYYDMYYLTNEVGVYKDIDWNSDAAVEFLAPPANNKDDRARIQKLLFLASQTSKSWGLPAAHYIHVFCTDPESRCIKCDPKTKKPIESDVIAYTWQKDNKGYTSMNFCPRFFRLRRLRDAALDYGKGLPHPENRILRNYDNTARVFLHELLHADYFMENEKVNHVRDFTISIDHGHKIENVGVYGPLYSKILARYEPDPKIDKNAAGWYVSRNADNMAWFATAKYVQNKVGFYPHLPVVYQSPYGPPFKKPSVLGETSTFSALKNPVFNIPPVHNDARQVPGTCASISVAPVEENGPKIKIKIKNLVPESAYPAKYRKELKGWIAEAKKYSATTTTPHAPPRPTCTGNQVVGNCMTNFLPTVPPFSGPQAPSCARADGLSGSAPRLNAAAVMQGAKEYCNTLARTKVVLGKDKKKPNAAKFKGKAEHGKEMIMAVSYDKGACPKDKSFDTLDFTKYSKQKCVDGFYTVLAQVCAQDDSWPEYNANFPLMGGVWGNDCAMWSLQSGK